MSGVDLVIRGYLVLTKHDHDKVGSLGKVNPPLRDERSQELLWEGLRDGTVTAWARTSHGAYVARHPA